VRLPYLVETDRPRLERHLSDTIGDDRLVRVTRTAVEVTVAPEPWQDRLLEALERMAAIAEQARVATGV
jgi:hypothetical protein